jgi:hypothetical protein
MTRRFEYGVARIQDLEVCTGTDRTGKTFVREVVLGGEPVQPSKRFWNSLHLRFGFTGNIFRYFSHAEVFARISATSPNDRIRWCLERGEDGAGTLLAVTNPSAALIRHDDLRELLERYGTAEIKYATRRGCRALLRWPGTASRTSSSWTRPSMASVGPRCTCRCCG